MRLRASWRGVPFEVQSESEVSGRRVQSWEYPGRDTPSGEDLGRKARRLSLAGFLSGDDIDTQRNALLSALDAPGSGLLIHPTLGPVQVYLEEYTRTESIDDARGLTLELSFVESGEEPQISALDPTGALSSAAAQALSDAAAAYAAAVAYAGQVDAVQAGLIADLRETTADIRRFTVDNPVARQVRKITELADALDDLDSAIVELAGAPADWAADLQNALLLIGSTAAFRLLTGEAGTTTPAVSGTTSIAVERDNTEANRQLYTHSNLATYAVALSQELAAGQWSRRGALAELATLTARIDAELDLGAPASLYDVRTAVAAEVSSRIAQLPDVAELAFDEPTSWLEESWRLYASTSRAEELWLTNSKGDPSMVTGTVEVFAP